MADAHADLETAKAILVLRDVFSADAITLDKAEEEIRPAGLRKELVMLFNMCASGSLTRSYLTTVMLQVLPSKRSTVTRSTASRKLERPHTMLQCRSSPASATMCAVGCQILCSR